MCTSDPLMAATSLHIRVASCLPGNLQERWGVSGRLCRKPTNGNEVAFDPRPLLPETDVRVKSPVAIGM